jgi:hypothetical protein
MDDTGGQCEWEGDVTKTPLDVVKEPPVPRVSDLT